MPSHNYIPVPRDVTNSVELHRFLSRLVEQLEENIQVVNLADLQLVQLTASAAYVQTELQAVADDVQNLQTSINSILGSLRKSKIIV